MGASATKFAKYPELRGDLENDTGKMEAKNDS